MEPEGLFFLENGKRGEVGGQAAISISWDGVTGVCGEISSLLSWELGGEKMGGIVRLGF
jgi:hypothetical protein